MVLRFQLFLCSILFFAPSLSFADEKPQVAVSVATYQNFLSDLLEGIAHVYVVVPGSISAHTWEPKPQDILKLKESVLWFCTGEPFEEKLLTFLKEQNSSIQFYDLRENICPIHSHCCCCHNKDDIDPHIWMSPKRLIQQIHSMQKQLEKTFPDSASLISKRGAHITQQIEKLDHDIQQTLRDSQGAIMIVSHDAYGYFCADYGLMQLPIEQEGKDPNVQELLSLIEKAKEAHVQTIFTQKQYSQRASSQLAELLDIQTRELDPYSKEYFETMHQITNAFHEEALHQKKYE